MRESTEERAKADPLSHSVDAEGKFWDHGGAPSFGAYLRAPVHAMPHPPAEGSLHELVDAMGVRALYQWVDGLWHVAGERMQRLAFSPAWLASRGWSYMRGVELDPSSDPIVTDVTLETTPPKSRAKRD